MKTSARRLAAAAAVALLCGTAAADDFGPPGDEPFTPAEYAAAVRATIEGRTVHETIGPSLTPLPLGLSDFLLDHPDLSAFIVRRRGIAPYRITMLGPRRTLADDGEGTTGIVDLLQSSPRRRLYYGEGVHHSRFFPDIRASAVIVMELREEPEPDGRPATVSTFEVFVRMRSRFVSGVIKTLRPFVQRTVIGKFSKAFLVADTVGRLMAADPDGVAADAGAFPAMLAEDRDEFLARIAGLKRLPGQPRP